MDAKRVLVIDDSEDIREAYAAFLEDEGYVVATAANGREGLQATRSFRPDLCIVDIVMPVMDGLDFLLALRSDFAPPLPHVILCSGFDGIDHEPLPAGATAFVPKPVHPPEFLALLRETLAMPRGAVPGKVPAAAEAALVRGREHATAARTAAVRAAQAAVAHTPFDLLVANARKLLQFLRGYFGADGALAAVFRDGEVTLIAADSSRELPAQTPKTIGEIIATGSTLVLTDISKHTSLVGDVTQLLGIRSFVGVPLTTKAGVVAGALCLGRTHLDPFELEDLLILQVGARRTAAMIDRMSAEGDPFAELPFVVTGGAVRSNVFQYIVDVELRLAARAGDALELAIVELSTSQIFEAVTAARGVVDPHRFVTGELGPRRIALFKRDADGAGLTRQIDAAVAAISSRVPVSAVGAVSVSRASAMLVDAPMLNRLAERQLAHATGAGVVERVVVALSAAPASRMAAPPPELRADP